MTMKTLLLSVILIFYLIFGIAVDTSIAQTTIEGYLVNLQTAEPAAGAVIKIANQFNIAYDKYGVDTAASDGHYHIESSLDTLYVQVIVPYTLGDQNFRYVHNSKKIIRPDDYLKVDVAVSELEFKYKLARKPYFDGYVIGFQKLSPTDEIIKRLAQTKFIVGGDIIPSWTGNLYKE
jgi:hypothetical protein